MRSGLPGFCIVGPHLEEAPCFPRIVVKGAGLRRPPSLVYLNNASTFCGIMLAVASMAVAVCCRICSFVASSCS